MNRIFDVNDFLKKAKEMGIEVEENVSETEAGVFACAEGSKELKKVNVSELFDN
ncbi:TPA_asm: hypothetical protein GYZ54_15385, partial [Listeria monocytogenes]|nr:hypothetical protein [Listeria monocytogenes]